MAKKLAAKKAKADSGPTSSLRVVPPLPKARPTKKVGVFKSGAAPGLRDTSMIELAHVKPLRVSKRFHLLDVAASFQAHAIGIATTRTAQVLAFDNPGDDSSSDVREAPSPGAIMEKHASSLPSVFRKFLHFSVAILTVCLDDLFC
jgi:hypothetical protein